MENTRKALIPLGRDIFPAALDIFPELRGYKARKALVYTARNFSLIENDSVNFALAVLWGQSGAVRYQACMLLAFAGRKDTIESPENLLEHKSSEIRADVQAAIEAIKARNHDLYIDRFGHGQSHLNIGGLIVP